MLIGLMLFYVGATLGINGIWLVGQARVARIEQRESVRVAAGTSGADSAVATKTDPRKHFTFLQDKEVAVINFFTAGVGVFAATLSMVMGVLHNNVADVAAAAFIMLFGFTYMFLGINQFLNAGNRVFGWFCFFIAVTAVPIGIYTLRSAEGNIAVTWLGIDWLAWAILWFVFFLLLTVELPITRFAGWAAIVVAIGTAWALGYFVLQGIIAFPL